jgi:hypothetical protein
MIGSRDNVSVVALRLPGARRGPAENGGVARRRTERARAQYANYNSQPATSPTVGSYNDTPYEDES